MDLKNILSQNWEKFLNFLDGFEKQRFLIMLEDINKYRVDAHAKDIEDEDFKQLRIHFDKLEKLEI